ncbi:MAG: hypothetical protein E3J72_05235 [Planctomycetota bacterium]|nr:MAG: hypothetical protein E3J72_05235 [Planctomycetota bacterium]
MICKQTGLLLKPSYLRKIYYKIMTAIPVLVSIVAMVRYADSNCWLIGYIGYLLVHFNILYASKCPHCPYYKMAGKLHSCFMIWLTPKIYKPRSGPAPKFLKYYVPFAILLMTFYPVYWLRYEWELLVVHLLAIAVLLISIMLQECTRCLYFKCPNNRVRESIQKRYRDKQAIEEFVE